MSEFSDRRAALAAARDERQAAADALSAARARAVRAEAALTHARRTGAATKRLERDRTAAEKAVATAGERLASLSEALAEAGTKFAGVADPRTAIDQLDDELPILLFPLRLETRFRGKQLWVRAFPDTCLVDTFEAELSQTEVASARRYWQALWRAPRGDEGAERTAWRAIVAGHGSGRARYVLATHAPLNADEQPDGPPEKGVALAVPITEKLDEDARKRVSAFWEAVWRQGGDAAAEAAALKELGDDDLREATRPVGLDVLPPEGVSREDAEVAVSLIVLPPADDAKERSWTRPARVGLLPDRLLCIVEGAGVRTEVLGEAIPSPLQVGPDPSGAPTLVPDGGDLQVPDELLWMTDFERAVEAGLGFKVALTPGQMAGVDRVTVVGVRLSDAPGESRALLEELIAHHHTGRGGISVLAQGTPTNNTEAAGAGHTRADDPDESFDVVAADLGDDDPLDRLDGRALADALGIEPAVVAPLPGAGNVDGREAHAMNLALWPATLGYFTQTLLDPVFSAADLEHGHWFFANRVTGRGPVPALRIGAQPYGILPATAFSRMKLTQPPRGRKVPPRERFVGRLLGAMRLADEDWGELVADVPSLAEPGSDPDATLLDVLGLHPASAEYHFRYAHSREHLATQAGLFGFAEALEMAIALAGLDVQGEALLQRYAYTGDRPDLLDKYFRGSHRRLNGPVVDDRPLSETEPVRDYTTDGRNYLEWLVTSARTSLEAVRRQAGFAGGRPPAALLYLLARHALLLGYADAAVRLHREAGAAEAKLREMVSEPAFVHVAPAGAGAESRWAPLLESDAAITGDPRVAIADHITAKLGDAVATRRLAVQLDALERLVETPTARLERLLAEHVDLCTYRFDAWRLGMVAHRLEEMRAKTPRGIHLGAYGWLEDIRPSAAVRTPVPPLGGDLEAAFQRPGDARLERDSANGGFIHAPSLDHAATAAVLRAGHLANAVPGADDALAVNLSSERVRLALSTLEGVRNGQSLGALLGYRFERGLHDRHDGLELDAFIADLRAEFPLVADRLPGTAAAGSDRRRSGARNVVDGLRLIELADTRADGYPWGRPLPAATAAEAAAIDEEVDRLRDLEDAIADLMLAEGVHQAGQGRFDAAAAALETTAAGGHPPVPEVVRTPRTGKTLTHRLALHLDPDAAAPADATPRAAAEPRIDAWLATVLPDLSDIACRVTWPGGEAIVTLEDLGLRPVDLLELGDLAGAQAMTELDDRVLARVLAVEDVPLAAAPAIEYLTPIAGHLRLLDVGALVRQVRTLLAGARPLRGADAAPTQEATRAEDVDVAADRTRVADALDALDAVRDDLAGHVAALTALTEDQPARRADAITGLDALVDDTATLFARAAAFGVPQTGWGFAFAWRRDHAATLLARVAERVAAWGRRLDDFDALLAAFDAAPGLQRAELLGLLRRAEVMVSTQVTPEPADLADLRAALPAKRTAFVARRDGLQAILDTPGGTLTDVRAEITVELPLTDVDRDPFELEAEDSAAVAFTRDALAAAAVVLAETRARSDAATAALAAHDAAGTAPERVAALTAAAQGVFGEGFILVPDAGVPPDRAAELANAIAASQGGDLTRHLTGTAGVELPVDEWLTGIARVRPKPHAWEQVAILAGLLGRAEPELTPLQLPFLPDDHWLALAFPPDAVLDRERLLYTAHLPPGFDPGARACGLLLDEWTEVIPGEREETGITAHFDRPSSEPPQAMLLVVPSTLTGKWDWDDVTGAIDDTLVLARKRAVEPAQLDDTAYARFLPATVMATTLRGISIGTSLAINNNVARFVKAVDDG